MNKEPESHRGEKASEKYWDTHLTEDEPRGNWPSMGGYFNGDKEVYDRLVSLEAKIELLKHIENSEHKTSPLSYAGYQLEQEYQQLIKEHNL